jgi:hypothetical protein
MSLRRLIGLIALIVGLSACATPVPPSGGPVDRSPPEIVRTEPAAGAVRVTGRTVRVEFSDWMDENAVERALTITPEPEGRPSFRWRRRSVEIIFPRDFQPNTTYVLTFDRNIRTHRGGTPAQPITIAFSTGDQIDEGQLSGTVVEPRRGNPMQGIDIFVYRGAMADTTAPPLASLPERPAYRTQTGADGAFRLRHVAEGPYYVIAVEDQNRNRRPDAGEPYAPPPHPWIIADTAGTAPVKPWILTVQDTLAPELNRVRSLSLRHLELRFNEAVMLVDRDPAEYELTAIDGPQPPAVAEVFARHADPRFAYLTLSGALSEGRYRLQTGPIADSLGNVANNLVAEFDAAPSPDTLRQRFVEFVPDTTAFGGSVAELLEWQRPGFRLRMPVDAATLQQALTVADTTGVPRQFTLRTIDGTTHRIDLEPVLGEGEYVDVTLNLNGVTAEHRFRRLAEAEVGEITGSVVRGDITSDIIVELSAGDNGERLTHIRLTDDDRFMFEHLPEGDYRIRAFVDGDGDGSWDGGSLIPYRRPAPIRWVEQVVTVRPRWETALPEPISFDAPPEIPTDEPVEREEDLDVDL